MAAQPEALTFRGAAGALCGPSSVVLAVLMNDQHLQSLLCLSEAAAMTLLKPVLLVPPGSFWYLDGASVFSIRPLVRGVSILAAVLLERL